MTPNCRARACSSIFINICSTAIRRRNSRVILPMKPAMRGYGRSALPISERSRFRSPMAISIGSGCELVFRGGPLDLLALTLIAESRATRVAPRALPGACVIGGRRCRHARSPKRGERQRAMALGVDRREDARNRTRARRGAAGQRDAGSLLGDRTAGL